MHDKSVCMPTNFVQPYHFEQFLHSVVVVGATKIGNCQDGQNYLPSVMKITSSKHFLSMIIKGVSTQCHESCIFKESFYQSLSIDLIESEIARLTKSCMSSTPLKSMNAQLHLTLPYCIVFGLFEKASQSLFETIQVYLSFGISQSRGRKFILVLLWASYFKVQLSIAVQECSCIVSRFDRISYLIPLLKDLINWSLVCSSD